MNDALMLTVTPCQRRSLDLSPAKLSDTLQIRRLLTSLNAAPGDAGSRCMVPARGTWEESLFFPETLRALETTVTNNSLLGGHAHGDRVQSLLRLASDCAGRTICDLGDTRHARALEELLAKFCLFLWLVDNPLDRWAMHMPSPEAHEFISALTDLYMDALEGEDRGQSLHLIHRAQLCCRALQDAAKTKSHLERSTLPATMLSDLYELSRGPHRVLQEVRATLPLAFPGWSSTDLAVASGLFSEAGRRYVESYHFTVQHSATLVSLEEYRKRRLHNAAMIPFLLLALLGVMRSLGLPPARLRRFSIDHSATWQRAINSCSLHCALMNDLVGVVKDVCDEQENMNAVLVVARSLTHRLPMESCLVEGIRVVAEQVDRELNDCIDAIQNAQAVDKEMGEALRLAFGSALAGFVYWHFGAHAAPRYSGGFYLLKATLNDAVTAQQMVRDLLLPNPSSSIGSSCEREA